MSSLEQDAENGEKEYWLDLAEKYKDAFAALADDPDVPAPALVSAGKEIFDRAYGKVANEVKFEGETRLLLDYGVTSPAIPSPEEAEDGEGG